MDRPGTAPSLEGSNAVDFDALRLEVSRVIGTSPIDESALRRAVWTYVGAARHTGTPPGQVIMTLTDIIEQAGITPLHDRQAATRRVILWCVEAYFGHLGGDVVGRNGMAIADTGAYPAGER